MRSLRSAKPTGSSIFLTAFDVSGDDNGPKMIRSIIFERLRSVSGKPAIFSIVLAGETKPKAALDDIYQTWEQITEHYGRENQKKLYAESYVA